MDEAIASSTADSNGLPEIGSNKTCENGTCERVFQIKKAAPHQRFCSSDCRSEWNNKRLKQGLELLNQQEKKEKGEKQENQS